MSPSGGLVRRAEAALAGLTDSDLRRKTASGELHRLRQGGYVDGIQFQALESAQRHAAAVALAVAAQQERTVVSHQSAAVLHGLPVWGVSLKRAHLTKFRRNAGRVTSSLHVHSSPLDEDDICLIGGLQVTDLARTVLDLALSESFESGVVVGDAALHSGKVSRERLAESLQLSGRRVGVARARLTVDFADGRSESVGESRSRVGMARAGLPAPGLQRRIYRDNGTLAGITDFDWPRFSGSSTAS